MTDVVARANMAALNQMDPAVREEAVTAYLERARDQLTLAVNLSGPEAVAAIKAEIATAAEATKQLGLSREIQTDAQEMVRRAEYALGKAIRAGQERGEIGRRGDNGSQGEYVRQGQTLIGRVSHEEKKTSAASFFSGGKDQAEVYAMVDNVTEAEFDAALSDAREEGNVSRANVVRKIKGVQAEGLTAVERLSKIRELAPTGMTSEQIGKELGLTAGYVRDRAREHGIQIVADKAVARSRRVDSNQVIAGTVEAAAIPTAALDLVDYSELDRDRLGEWISSLSESIKTLRALRSRLEKELTND